MGSNIGSGPCCREGGFGCDEELRLPLDGQMKVWMDVKRREEKAQMISYIMVTDFPLVRFW